MKLIKLDNIKDNSIMLEEAMTYNIFTKLLCQQESFDFLSDEEIDFMAYKTKDTEQRTIQFSEEI